jgi:hypothetical protein
MSLKIDTLQSVRSRKGQLTKLKAVAGFDGFVDRIIQVVDQRRGPGADYDALTSIESFGRRVLQASGKSTNLEFVCQLEKVGGNGPIMGQALVEAGVPLRYIGALGSPDIHPVFHDFASKTAAISLCAPGITNAIEFHDGKLLCGEMASLDEITYMNIIKAVGKEAFYRMFAESNLIALVNWTMIPHLTSVFADIATELLPQLPKSDHRIFFFDLADPQKRSQDDLRKVLQQISRFEQYGSVTLGLNLKEGLQVYDALIGTPPGESPEDLRNMASAIREKLDINTVLIHPTRGASCANRESSWYVDGPWCARPKLTTGAGDHFNAGFALSQLLKLPPDQGLTLAVSTSGYYVREGKSPTIDGLEQFLEQWDKGLSD